MTRALSIMALKRQHCRAETRQRTIINLQAGNLATRDVEETTDVMIVCDGAGQFVRGLTAGLSSQRAAFCSRQRGDVQEELMTPASSAATSPSCMVGSVAVCPRPAAAAHRAMSIMSTEPSRLRPRRSRPELTNYIKDVCMIELLSADASEEEGDSSTSSEFDMQKKESLHVRALLASAAAHACLKSGRGLSCSVLRVRPFVSTRCPSRSLGTDVLRAPAASAPAPTAAISQLGVRSWVCVR
mmetsp:Transcript_65459/g.213051  ORF Transcript_65459/g.213051 Transcript_65459/m.213051 type:complete len:242 (-) Transcript_65459:138-863(-)